MTIGMREGQRLSAEKLDLLYENRDEMIDCLPNEINNYGPARIRDFCEALNHLDQVICRNEQDTELKEPGK